MCDLGDREIAACQQFFCLIDSPVDQIIDRGDPLIARENVNHIIFIHIRQFAQRIQIDILRKMLIQILLNKMTLPGKFVCCGEVRGGDGVAVYELNQDFEKVLADVDVIFLLLTQFLEQGLGVKKAFLFGWNGDYKLCMAETYCWRNEKRFRPNQERYIPGHFPRD